MVAELTSALNYRQVIDYTAKPKRERNKKKLTIKKILKEGKKKGHEHVQRKTFPDQWHRQHSHTRFKSRQVLAVRRYSSRRGDCVIRLVPCHSATFF